MAIDRIGKGGAPPLPAAGEGVASSDKAGKAEKATRTFEVQRPDTAASGQAGMVQGASALERTAPLSRLRAGEIDVGGYLDLKVDEATRNLQGLGVRELAEVKKMLREQLASDPGLADLVKQATGAAPPPVEE